MMPESTRWVPSSTMGRASKTVAFLGAILLAALFVGLTAQVRAFADSHPGEPLLEATQAPEPPADPKEPDPPEEPESPEKPQPPEEPAPEEPGEEDEESEPEEEPFKSGFTEDEEKQLAYHFATQRLEFLGERRIQLTYDFNDDRAELGNDFDPPVTRKTKSMRWSRGHDRHPDYYDGLVVNKMGFYMHKTEWDTVELNLSWGQLSEIAETKDIVAAVFIFGKGSKRIIGSNLGQQCVKLSSGLAHKARPVPPIAVRPPNADSGVDFGMRVADGELFSLLNGRVKSSTKSKKFVKGLRPGHVGIAWRGRYVKGIIPKVTIAGRPTEQWLKKNVFE